MHSNHEDLLKPDGRSWFEIDEEERAQQRDESAEPSTEAAVNPFPTAYVSPSSPPHGMTTAERANEINALSRHQSLAMSIDTPQAAATTTLVAGTGGPTPADTGDMEIAGSDAANAAADRIPTAPQRPQWQRKNLTCWNCKEPGHRYEDCLASCSKCFRAGKPGVYHGAGNACPEVKPKTGDKRLWAADSDDKEEAAHKRQRIRAAARFEHDRQKGFALGRREAAERMEDMGKEIDNLGKEVAALKKQLADKDAKIQSLMESKSKPRKRSPPERLSRQPSQHAPHQRRAEDSPPRSSNTRSAPGREQNQARQSDMQPRPRVKLPDPNVQGVLGGHQVLKSEIPAIGQHKVTLPTTEVPPRAAADTPSLGVANKPTYAAIAASASQSTPPTQPQHPTAANHNANPLSRGASNNRARGASRGAMQPQSHGNASTTSHNVNPHGRGGSNNRARGSFRGAMQPQQPRRPRSGQGAGLWNLGGLTEEQEADNQRQIDQGRAEDAEERRRNPRPPGEHIYRKDAKFEGDEWG